MKPKIAEAEAEKMADRIVWSRLSRDFAYQNAEDAASQSSREEVISAVVWSDLAERFDIQ